MDQSIAQKFIEKNREIMSNKLSQDIDNNDDSLRKTIENKISLLIDKTTKTINNILKDNNVSNYEFKQLSDFFVDKKEKLTIEVNNVLDERKILLKEYIKKDFSPVKENIEKSFEDLHSKIKTSLDEVINNIIYINISEELSNIIRFPNSETKNTILEKLNSFDFEITDQIDSSIVERNYTLINVIIETNEKICELNNKTSEEFL